MPVCDGSKWGYIGLGGSVQIRCQYDGAWEFRDGLGVVSIGGLRGIVDGYGETVVEPRYGSLHPISGRRYAYEREGVWGVLDAISLEETPVPDASEIGRSNRHRLAPFRAIASGDVPHKEAGKWGYVDFDGNTVISPRFDEATWFEGKLARVRVGDKWGLIDSDGNYVREPKLDYINFIEPWPGARWRKRFRRVRNDGRYGFMHRDGQWLLRPTFTAVSEFAEQWAAACDPEGVWGFVDTAGYMKLRMVDTEVPDGRPRTGFWKGLTAVEMTDGNTTWIDPAGKVRIPSRSVYRAWRFWPDGRAVVWISKESKTVTSAMMDTKGVYLFGPRECMIMPVPLTGGLRRIDIRTGEANVRTYVNRDGEVLWLPEGHPWATSGLRVIREK